MSQGPDKMATHLSWITNRLLTSLRHDLRLKQNGCQFADNIFKLLFVFLNWLPFCRQHFQTPCISLSTLTHSVTRTSIAMITCKHFWEVRPINHGDCMACHHNKSVTWGNVAEKGKPCGTLLSWDLLLNDYSNWFTFIKGLPQKCYH